MGLINCQECKAEISSTATACPKCGAPNKKHLSKAQIIVGLLVGIAAIVYLASDDNSNTQHTLGSQDITPTTKADEPQDTEAAKIIRELESQREFFKPGSYAEGDIPKGEYAFVSPQGGYFEEKRAGEILANQNFASFGYVYVNGIGDVTAHGFLIKADRLPVLGFSGAKAAYEAVSKTADHTYSGYYHVGRDIQPGTYIVESTGEAYISVNSGPVGKSEILNNDNFNGSKTVRLRDGQYLELNRASIRAKN